MHQNGFKYVFKRLLSIPEFFQIFWSDLNWASACASRSKTVILAKMTFFGLRENNAFWQKNLLKLNFRKPSKLYVKISNFPTSTPFCTFKGQKGPKEGHGRSESLIRWNHSISGQKYINTRTFREATQNLKKFDRHIRCEKLKKKRFLTFF